MLGLKQDNKTKEFGSLDWDKKGHQQLSLVVVFVKFVRKKEKLKGGERNRSMQKSGECSLFIQELSLLLKAPNRSTEKKVSREV